MSSPELIAVVGPNGSGKSSAIYETSINDNIIFVNPDDIARSQFSHIEDEDARNRHAWFSCNAQREALLAECVSFGFETVGSHPSKVDFLRAAKDLGYTVIVLFVATESPGINIERIKQRQLKGGHGVPDEKVISRYGRTLDLLYDYFQVADYVRVWDNSIEAETSSDSAMRELVRKTPEGIEVLEDARDVSWAQRYLLSKLDLPKM